MGKYISNKGDKQEEAQKGGWVAAWADDISETDVLAGVVAAGISISSGNPAPFIAWVKALVNETITTLMKSATTQFPQAIIPQVVEIATEVIKAAIQGQDANEVLKQYDTVDFKAGAIRYSGRNYEWSIFTQEYVPITPPTWGIKPYVMFRWRGSGTTSPNTGPGATPPGGGGIDTGTPLDPPGQDVIDTGTPF